MTREGSITPQAGPEILDAWLNFKVHNQGKAENTASKYRGLLMRLNKHLAGDGVALIEASGEQLEHFAGIVMHEAGLSPRGRRPLIAAIRGFYAWLRRTGRRADDPAKTLDYPRVGRPLPIPMSIQSAERLFMQPDIGSFIGLRDAAMLSLLIGCGLRVGGLCSLNESGLQFTDIEGKEWLLLRLVEKGGAERVMPAPQVSRMLVRAYLAHEDMKVIDRTTEDSDRVLFVSIANRNIAPHEYHGERRRISAKAVWDRVRHYAARAGIPVDQAHPHAMRHLYGTELTEHDVPTLTVQTLLGHADPKTSAIYSRLATRKLAEVVDRANPFRRIRSPLTDLARELERRSR